MIASARPIARHCPELTSRGPDPAALLPLLARMGERLARRLAGALAPLLGGEAPMVRCAAPEADDAAGLATRIDALAGNSLLTLAGGEPLLMSIEASAVLRIVDRAFGGKGEAPSPLPEALPMAAELMIARLETLVAAQISGAVDAVRGVTAGTDESCALVALRRDAILIQLAPFTADTPLVRLSLTIEEAGVPPWDLLCALPLAALPALLGGAEAKRRKRPPHSRQAAAGEAPFADVPLPLSAVIVDMVLPFATVGALRVGQVLPVTVARAVPLRIGAQTVAQGTIGAVDDRIAIQITQAF